MRGSHATMRLAVAVGLVLGGLGIATGGLPVNASQAAPSGHLIAWGANDSRQLQVPIDARTGVSAVAGSPDIAAVLKDGGVQVWTPSGYSAWFPAAVPDDMQSGVTAITVGSSYVLVVKAGRVKAWGLDRLNRAAEKTDWVPLDVPSAVLSNVTDIEASGTYAIANRDGEVHVWTYFGGYGWWELMELPTPLFAASGVDQITGHLTALKDGRVYAWRYAYEEGLESQIIDLPVPMEAQSGVSAVASSSAHTLALKFGRVIAWEHPDVGEDRGASHVAVPVDAQSGVESIAARGYHSLAVKGGRVIAWGDNRQAQSIVPIEAQSGVVAVASGGSYALAIKHVSGPPDPVRSVTVMPGDGQAVVAWEHPVSSQPASSFTAVATPGGHRCVAVTPWRSCTMTGLTSGTRYTVTVVAANEAGTSAESRPSAVFPSGPPQRLPGAVVAWGWSERPNAVSEVGVPIETRYGVTAVAAGNYLTAALKNGGVVMSSLALNYQKIIDRPVQVPQEFQSGVDAIDFAWNTLVALKDGKVLLWSPEGGEWEWQWNSPSEAQSGVTAIAGGSNHVLAVKSGRVISWGFDYVNERVVSLRVPQELQSGVTAIAAGGDISLALKDGRVFVWEHSSDSDEYFEVLDVPEDVRSGVSAISATGGLMLALKHGRVIAWGSNTRGQASVPSEARTGVSAIAAGELHSLALKNGGVLAWGSNRVAGDVRYSGQSVVPKGAKSNITAIAAGWYHSVAIGAPVVKNAPAVPRKVRSAKVLRDAVGNVRVTFSPPRPRTGRFLVYEAQISGEAEWRRDNITSFTFGASSVRGRAVLLRAVNEAGPGPAISITVPRR